MQGGGAGGAALGPAAAENAGDAIDKIVAAPLHRDKRHRREAGGGEPEEGRQLEGGVWLQLDQAGEAKGGKGKLGDKFEGYVDDRAGRRIGARHAGQCQHTGAEHIAADLRQRQGLGAGITYQPGPDHLPRRYSRQQGAPPQPHQRGQYEVNRADRREAERPNRQQRMNDGAGPEIADKRHHRRHANDGGKDR